jgi:hypothetical protein
VPDPSAVSQPSSQPPPSRCCDDSLNPSNTPRVRIRRCWSDTGSSRR